MKQRLLWITAMLLIVVLALAACQTAAPATTEEAGATQVEVFSWWTGGGEAAGLDAMIQVFNTEYPDIEFVNSAVAGGAGTNARAVLASRLQAGDPPDSWQRSEERRVGKECRSRWSPY